MNLKLDENLPESLLVALSSLGHDVETVRMEQLVGQDDDVIWRRAQDESRFLITQDMDFSDIRKFAPGTHAGLLLVRLRAPSRLALFTRIESLFREENTKEWEKCFVVATDQKLRVRRS